MGLEKKGVAKTIGTEDLEDNIEAILDDVARQHAHYLVERNQQPAAALIPLDDYLRLSALQEDQILAQVDQVLARMAQRNAAFSDEEVARDVTAAASDVR